MTGNVDTTIETIDPSISFTGTTDISLFTERSVTKSTIHNTSMDSILGPPGESGKETVKPRPRPRPAYKGVKDANAAVSGTASPIEPSTSIIRPADHSSISSTSIRPSPSIQDITGADTDLSKTLPLGIAEQAKLRTRNAQPKKKAVLPEDIIDLSSDDEISAWSTKPKPKAKSKKPVRAGKRSKASHLPVDAFVSDHDLSFDIPVPTSDMPHILGADLPPSDPPTSSSSRIPVDLTQTDGPHVGQRISSPLSSPVVAPNRKRKRPVLVLDDDDDDELDVQKQMDSVHDNEIANSAGPPPPLFFAGSSSPPVIARPRPKTSPIPASPKSSKTKATTRMSDPVVVKAPAKKAASRKKARDDSDEEWNDDAPSKSRKKKGDDSDSDDDWGKKKKKSPAKSKRKQPAKKPNL